MANWDPPFPFDAKRIRPADEEYWDRYGPTPKAFVSLADRPAALGQPLRADHVDPRGVEAGRRLAVAERECQRPSQEHLDPAAMGFVFQPVRQQGLAASAGTTPFGVLFLCFSFFIIAAAVMLVALLFRLGIERRAGADRHAAGRRTVAATGRPAAAGRRAGRGRRRQPARRAGRNRLRRADAAGTAHLVAGRHRHALPAAPRDGREPGDRLRQRTCSSRCRPSGFRCDGWAGCPQRRLLAGQTVARKSRRSCRSAGNWRFEMAALLSPPLAPTAALLPGSRAATTCRRGAFFGAGAAALAALLALVWLRLAGGHDRRRPCGRRRKPACAWPCATPREIPAAAR